MNKKLEKITATAEGYEVKQLRWLPLDNIIVGLVKCPLFGKPDMHDGYIACQWTRRGKPIKNNKGREDLILNIPNDEANNNIL